MKEPKDPVEAINACVKAVEEAHAEMVRVVEEVAREINRIWRDVREGDTPR